MNLDANFFRDTTILLNKYLKDNDKKVTLSLRVSARGWIKLESSPNILSWDLGCTNNNVEYYKEITKEIKPFFESFKNVKYIDNLDVCTCQREVNNKGKMSCSMCYESLFIPNKEGFVYAISDKSSVKIGVTKRDPYLRLKEMQTGNPKILRVVKFWNINNIYAKEEEIHRKMKNKNIRGEWFKMDFDIIGEVNNIIYETRNKES